MKATKALKRLNKIEALMSDVVEKYSTTAPSIRKALQDAMVAVTVAKEAVSLETSSGKAAVPTVKEKEKASAFPTEPLKVKKSKQNTSASPVKPSSKKSKRVKKKDKKVK